MQAMNVLLIEDDPKIAKLLEEYLRGFHFTVKHFDQALPAIAHLEKSSFDILLLDVMLPDIDGFQALKKIRHFSQIPVIMLTARGELTDRIVGLEIGADDYLPKPFEPRELVARMQSLLRRTKPQTSSTIILKCEALSLDMGAFIAMKDGVDLQLTTHEIELLNLLMRNAQKVLTREMIIDQLTGIESAAFDRSIDIAISRLRQKFGDNPKEPAWIKTVWGQGYLFMKPVSN